VSHSGLFDALHELTFGCRIEPKHVPYRWTPRLDGWSCEELACERAGGEDDGQAELDDAGR
jgi:hypothetical protein